MQPIFYMSQSILRFFLTRKDTDRYFLWPKNFINIRNKLINCCLPNITKRNIYKTNFTCKASIQPAKITSTEALYVVAIFQQVIQRPWRKIMIPSTQSSDTLHDVWNSYPCNDLLTFTDSDPDSNNILILGSWNGASESDSMQCKKFCLLQWSALESESRSGNVDKPQLRKAQLLVT